MLPRLGPFALGVWGFAMSWIPIVLFVNPLFVWANSVLWAVVYAYKPMSWKWAAVQFAATVAAVVAGAFWVEPVWDPRVLVALVVFAFIYFVAWMLPVEIAAAYLEQQESK